MPFVDYILAPVTFYSPSTSSPSHSVNAFTTIFLLGYDLFNSPQFSMSSTPVCPRSANFLDRIHYTTPNKPKHASHRHFTEHT